VIAPQALIPLVYVPLLSPGFVSAPGASNVMMRGSCALTTELRNGAQRRTYKAGATLQSSPKRFRKALVFFVIVPLFV
jgi:hypothetical protein